MNITQWFLTKSISSNSLKTRYKSLIYLCLLSGFFSLFFFLVAVFALKDLIQSVILFFFVAAAFSALALIKYKGWLILPALIVITIGYLMLSSLFLISQNQIFSIGVWYMLYHIFIGYFLQKKHQIIFSAVTVLIIIVKTQLVSIDYYIIPLPEEKLNTPIIYKGFQLITFLTVILGVIYIILENSRKSQNTTEELLQNREILMKEIHHRVKNNLQIMQSLLELQKKKLTDINHRTSLNIATSRISSMALIHEMLYESSNLNSIELRGYIDRLGKGLSETHSQITQLVQPKSNDSIFLQPDVAIPFGLILNELITNSIQHALNPSGIIDISISLTSDKKISIIYSDNGTVPLSDDLFNKVHDSLGIKIINSLIKQVRGQIIQLPSTSGLKVEILLSNPKLSAF